MYFPSAHPPPHPCFGPLGSRNTRTLDPVILPADQLHCQHLQNCFQLCIARPKLLSPTVLDSPRMLGQYCETYSQVSTITLLVSKVNEPDELLHMSGRPLKHLTLEGVPTFITITTGLRYLQIKEVLCLTEKISYLLLNPTTGSKSK